MRQKRQNKLLKKIKKKEADLKKMTEISSKGVSKMMYEGNALFRDLSGLAIVGLAIMLRKEFRIKGCIGDPDQKDKLSFISSKDQINDAQQSRYTENGIATGVIWSMHSSL